MNNLFERAKQIALDNVMQFVPAGGNRQGDEYKCLNPLRSDSHIGSFSINVKTGSWADFADDNAQGRDCISLYAYLNHDRLETQARNDGYKNINAAIQTVAAKELLMKFDSSYFPSSEDDFTPPKTERVDPAHKWDGFRYVNYKLKDIPEIDFTKYKSWGSFVESWDFIIKGRLVFKVARFIEGKKKTDIPFTLWIKGGSEIKWRPKAPQEEYPLWNVEAVLNDKENKEVVLTEGQKAASRYKEDKYIAVGFYGGANNSKATDWSTLMGRNVIFFPDGDTAGRKLIPEVRKYAEQYDFKLTIAKTPTNVKKGYDLADAIAEGKDLEEILHPKSEITKEDDAFLDDITPPFNIVGTSGSDIVFYVHNSCRIEKCKGANLTKNFLMTIAPRDWWGSYFNKGEGGISWEAAMDWIIRKSDNAKVFDFNRVRGVGAWRDGDDIVINTGEYLLIGGKRVELKDKVGDYLYIKAETIPYRYEKPCALEDSQFVARWLERISWNNKIAPKAMLGWITLAPWGGLLRWRSYIWIVGPSGSGKSTIIEKFLHPMVINEFGTRGDGLSTPAGIRQSLANTSKPFVGDEMEGDTKTKAENIEQILQMFRSSSSGTEGAAILMGTQDGQGQRFVVQSMALFASIGAAIKHGADANRFTICELVPERNSKDRQKNFKVIKEGAARFTTAFARAYHARTYQHIDEVLATVDIFREETAAIMENMRDGDQLGTLLGGAYFATHESMPTHEEVRSWLTDLDIKTACKSEQLSDEEQCFDAILSSKVEISNKYGHMYLNVSEAIEYLQGFNEGDTEDEELPVITPKALTSGLGRIGLKLKVESNGYYLLIATNHKAIKQLLRDTSWGVIYVDVLKRLKDAEIGKSSTTFAGQQSRYIKILYGEEQIPF